MIDDKACDEGRLVTPGTPRGAPALPATGACDAAAASGDAAASGYLSAGRLSAIATAAAAAGELARRLLAAPRTERLGMIASDTAYRLPHLARLLALAAEEQLDGPPPAAEEAAELALAIAIALAPATAEERRLRPFCHWLLGKAQLRGGRLDDAETNFTSMGRPLAAAGERALAAAGLAQLRWQQRRTPEAWALFAAAGRAFAEILDAPAAGACRGLAGFLLLADEPMLAQLDLREAHRALNREQAPSLAVLICLGLAHCESALGGPAAPHFFTLARDTARQCAEPAPILGGWWEAVLGLGRDPGEAKLDAARRQALARGDTGAVARATLAQALRRIAGGDGESAAALAAPLAALPGEGRIWSEEIAALGPLAAARPGSFRHAPGDLALRLAAQAIPRLGAQGLPWGVCDLADRLLCQRLEGEHPIGAARDL